MATRKEGVDKLVKTARGQVGLEGSVRSPIGSNNIKYNTKYYGRKVHDAPGHTRDHAWCVVFIWWCMRRAGMKSDVFPMTASVANTQAWFAKHGRWKTKSHHRPMKGDLVIYNDPDVKGLYNHIGIVVRLVDEEHFQTVEGNWNDRVTLRKPISIHYSQIEGYCIPNYGRGKPATTTTPTTTTDKTTEAIVKALPRLHNGIENSAAVRRLQGLLVANGHPLPKSTANGKFDGDFGDETEKALEAATGSKVADHGQWQKLLGV